MSEVKVVWPKHLRVCPECGSAVVTPNAWVPPEFVTFCRHRVGSSGDVGRNVRRVDIDVIPTTWLVP